MSINTNTRFDEFRGRARLAWSIVRGRDGNIVRHAQREVAHMLHTGEDSPDRWMAVGLVDLARVFSTQGHSGFSAPWCVSALERLLRFEPLRPLTGEDAEWGEIFDPEKGTRQNKRCSHVFSGPDGAYDNEGVVFREPGGCSFTCLQSRVPVRFPYTPKTVYADVPDNSTDEQRTEAAREALEAIK